MRKFQIESLKIDDNLMTERLEAKYEEVTPESIKSEFSIYKSELEKERYNEFIDRLKPINEATIAYHAANKKIPNRHLMLKHMMVYDDINMLGDLEAEDVTVKAEMETKATETNTRKIGKKSARSYLKTITKDDIKTLDDAKDMLWHLKNLIG